MESYIKSWEGISKEYPNITKRRSDKFRMKNSLKFEEDKDKDGCNESGIDSLAIHCVVQTFSSLNDLKTPHHQHYDEKINSGDSWWECECKKSEMSGCVVIPENTSMDDLTKTALVKLGYPASISSFATGSILIRNWKPLSLEVICPDMRKTVADILGEITAVVSLRIQIFKPKITLAQKMKDDLLLFLIKANQNFLRDSCCPFDPFLLLKFCDQTPYLKTHLLEEAPEDLQRKFNVWLEHLQENGKAATEQKTQLSTSFFFLSNNGVNNNVNDQNIIEEKRSPSLGAVESSTQESNGNQVKMPLEKENLNFVKEPLFRTTESHKHFTTPKARVRTSFDPEFELPKLQKWFLKNPHPTRQQIYEYVTELNSLDSRKGRKHLDVNNVVYWFKNARAAQKRTEYRRFSNASPTETNRCNVLKIPLAKNCGVTSDDQRSISDDEASALSESGDDCRQENRRCLQVVGKWNSNGQGEAVLEMQIPSHKSEFSPPVLLTKKDSTNEKEENSKNTCEESNNSSKQDSYFEKKDANSGVSDRSFNQQENRAVEENKSRTKIDEINEKKENQVGGNRKKSEICSKVPVTSNFSSFKEKNRIADFSVPPNSVLNPSFICMSKYMSAKPSSLPLSSEERRKRNRTFIDPVTEVPRLEQWFRLSTHPSHNLIARYTEELNSMPYRKKFPKLEAKNVQFWFKNRRAKNKRLNYLEINNN